MMKCNNGGGGGNFSKVKRLLLKCIGTHTRICSKFRQPVWAVRNAVTFSQGILQQDNHICIFSPTPGLLESAIELEVRAFLGAWQIVWSDFGGCWHCSTQATTKARVFISLKNQIFCCWSLELLKILAFVVVHKVTVFTEPYYIVVTP